MEIIKSVSLRDDEIIRDIIKLHVPQGFIDLDPTYSKGIFYKDMVELEPVMKSDLFPKDDSTIECDFTNLHFVEDDSINCIVFDPPFVVSGKTYKDTKDGSSMIGKRFGVYHSWDEIKESYTLALIQFKKKLKDGGVVMFKCQDTITGGKNLMTHTWVMYQAVALEFYPKDLFIKESKSKMTSFGGRWKNQQHAMKYHSYWWVFENKKSRVDYTLLSYNLG